ncbi:MAG: C40 family peptidase [Lachnospiraceae bacterium]|jgi:cell wall-associated NlpC family hydrolase|nr:C40 family peptidase [Lachnospiraceae bacterium]
MKKSTVKWFLPVIFVSALVLAIIMVSPVDATTISDLQRQQRVLRQQREEELRRRAAEQQQLDNVTGNIGGMEHDAGIIADEIAEIDEALVMVIASIDILTEEIEITEENIIITTILYEEAKATEEAQYLAMKMRLKHMYETSTVSLLQMLIDSTSLGNILNRLEFMEQLNGYDEVQLEAYIRVKEETNALREQLEDERAFLAAQQYELEVEKLDMEILLTEKVALFENFEAMIAEARREAARYTASIRAMNDQIRRLERDEASARAREQELIRAEEEARRLANQSSGSRNYLPPSSFSGSTGERISAYARQFVGNPYVFGGTSLTQGADCSGFIWRVYRDFGFNVPRTSASFRTAGTGVEFSNARPGDVICYAGHVGLYIGNGNIVHASTERTGIVISRATYRPILAVRRFV